MTRQLEVKAEERESLRREELVKALEFALPGAIEHQGGTLRGFSIQFGMFDCLLTLRADFEGKWFVAYMGSDTMMNCILKAQSDVAYGRVHWDRDKYQPDSD